VEVGIELRERDSAGQAVVPPLAVDLDGALVKTDLLVESLLALLKRQPLFVFALPIWLLKGKAHFKREIASRTWLDASLLPYRRDFLESLEAERKSGRRLVLATGSDGDLARRVASYLKLFDDVFASDGAVNLSGESKRDRLVREFGEKGFDYAGHARCDLAVWASARKAVVVNAGPGVALRVTRIAEVDRVFRDRKKGLAAYLKPLRLRHWVKNLLVFVPLLAAHEFHEPGLLARTALAFLAFGCVASANYLMNDLLDLPADRQHPRKRLRAFAAGDLPLWYALAAIPVLAALGCLIGAAVAPLLLVVLLSYLALSAAYSLVVKKLALLDVIFLAGLYTVRILAGSAAIGIWPSYWLLAFSVFLFFSLALVKRYAELMGLEVMGANGRGYETGDRELLAAMGICSGYLSVLVLALYITSEKAQLLYTRPEFMWFPCALLLYWVSHLWLAAHRGKMPDDPVVFATRDRTSRILLLLMFATAGLAL
jgi:4-hydroxybenzoate polyprenyltransferase